MKFSIKKMRRISKLKSSYKGLNEAFIDFKRKHEEYTDENFEEILQQLVESHEKNNFNCIIEINAGAFLYRLATDAKEARRTLLEFGRFFSHYKKGNYELDVADYKIKYMEDLKQRLLGYTEHKGNLNELLKIGVEK